jgi:stress response protein YsnF
MYSIRKETHQRISSLTEQRDAAKAELAAMTADRNLYRDDHDGEDHPYSEVVALKAENDRLRAALKNGEEMYIAMRDRCARTEAALNKATGPEGSAK